MDVAKLIDALCAYPSGWAVTAQAGDIPYRVAGVRPDPGGRPVVELVHADPQDHRDSEGGG